MDASKLVLHAACTSGVRVAYDQEPTPRRQGLLGEAGSAWLPQRMDSMARMHEMGGLRIEAGDREEIAVIVHKLPPLHSDEAAVCRQDSPIRAGQSQQQRRCRALQDDLHPHRLQTPAGPAAGFRCRS